MSCKVTVGRHLPRFLTKVNLGFDYRIRTDTENIQKAGSVRRNNCLVPQCGANSVRISMSCRNIVYRLPFDKLFPPRLNYGVWMGTPASVVLLVSCSGI
ncbi:hypothetical protein PDE_08497 [Penicillium oxalicum 114-2]|uniref:Uncharacterized protein n=1 Tax=Penicillium oxalicum (strain 114-2 / CGMCC 5302) TaxID=933388 RepID=S7ZS39_PENO1|nr:hypothetical protein PDE_08497 [Penicillium oxalicum 114-2]